MSDAHDHAHEHHDHPGLAVAVEHTDTCVINVKITVDSEEFERTVANGLRNVGRNTRLKGFRPGKIPLPQLEKRFGSEVRRDAVKHFLEHGYRKAIADEELRPATDPRIEVEPVTPAAGEGFTHEFEVWLRPQVELGEYKELVAETQPQAVSDEELEHALADFESKLSRPEPAGDEGLPADGMAVCQVAFFGDGAEEPALERDGLGVDAQAFEEGLTGAQEGQVCEFAMEFPEEFPEEALRNTTGKVVVTVKEALRVVKPEEHELREALGLEEDQDLRENVRERILTAKQEQEEQRLETLLLERVIDQHELELAQPLLDRQVEAKLTEVRAELEAQEVPAEELDERVEAERGEAVTGATRALRAIYVMEEIAKAEEIDVGDEDLRAELQAIAARNNVPLEQVAKYYQEQGLFQQLALELLERKVRRFLRESADIREAGPAA
jgi:trigger factor